MKLDVLKIDGTKAGRQIELSDQIFGIEPNETVVYEDVRRVLANRRQGTAKTKERSEVRGSTRKLFKQKGTGGARRGSLRSPLLKGGGTVFGPKPHAYTNGLTKKMRRLARKSALSSKMSKESIIVVEKFSFDVPKTKQMISLIAALQAEGKKILLLTDATDMNVFKSAKNIQKVKILEADKPSTYDILNADLIVFQEPAVAVLENTFSANTVTEE